MRLSNSQYIIFSGLFQLLISLTYTMIGISNYEVDWFDFEWLGLKDSKLFKLRNSNLITPELTWGLASFNVIMTAVFVVLWNENEKKDKGPELQNTPFGLYIFGLALLLFFAADYRNELILSITGSYGFLSAAHFLLYKMGVKSKS